jgi:glucose/mannose-6-phosphate isomerase
MITEPEIQRMDRADMRGFIGGMSEHIRDAIELTETNLHQISIDHPVSNVIVCAVGGSAIAGDLVRSYLKDLSVPIIVQRGYDLPSIAGPDSLIVVASYSGNTEESLSLFEQAVRQKLSVVAITTGGRLAERCAELKIPILPQSPGMQPRAALAYGFVPLLLLLQHVGLCADQSNELDSAAVVVGALADREGVVGSASFELAERLQNKIAVIYSAEDPLGSVGTRWRGQLQENAKHLAFSSVLPEMNHNEINAWQHPADLMKRMHVILLRSTKDEHQRIHRRFAILKEYLTSRNVSYSEVSAEGDSCLARTFSLIAMGDWTSYWLAILTDTDPTPIPAIDYLKNRLA